LEQLESGHVYPDHSSREACELLTKAVEVQEGEIAKDFKLAYRCELEIAPYSYAGITKICGIKVTMKLLKRDSFSRDNATSEDLIFVLSKLGISILILDPFELLNSL
jgi:hypothetical protein